MLVNIDKCPMKLVYETDWLEKGEWKNFDGSVDCNEEDATGIVIVESSDERMPMNFFQRYPEIKSMEMTDKRLKSIETDDLLHANSLLRLNVSHNEIDRIAAFAFEAAPTLTEIDLSFNLLHDLNENIFTSHLIKYLYLDHNQLSTVNELWFERLSYLRVLTLNNNRIRAIDFRLFDFMPTINVLHLHSNEITELNNERYQQTPRSMQTFSMHDNAVASESHHLIWLNADMVDVRNTGVQICRISQRMRTVIAANNEIREINLDNLSVPHQNALVTLHLANNRLQSIENVTYFPHLQYLNLTHNLVSHVEAKVFAALGDLHLLDLSHNQLKQFAVQNNRMPSLSVLDVSFNEISTLDLGGIMSQLQTLNIDGNQITATDSVIKKRHVVNHECLSDSATCQSDQTTNPDEIKHSKQKYTNNGNGEYIHEQFHIMEKNILQLIDSQFEEIRRRINRLEEKMNAVSGNTADTDPDFE